MDSPKRGRGRPPGSRNKVKEAPKRIVGFTHDLADRICEELEKGRTLIAICKDEGMPSHRAVHRWVRENVEDFSYKYRLARETQLNFWIDQIHEIASLPPPIAPDIIFVKDGKLDLRGDPKQLSDGEKKLWVNAELQGRRLKVDSIKFVAAKASGVMNYNDHNGITVQGDKIIIMNYATPPPAEAVVVEALEVENRSHEG